MRRLAALLVLVGLAGAQSQPAADAVLEAFRAKDTNKLRELAARKQPDPWIVGDVADPACTVRRARSSTPTLGRDVEGVARAHSIDQHRVGAVGPGLDLDELAVVREAPIPYVARDQRTPELAAREDEKRRTSGTEKDRA